jgi:hypothetical protein
MYVCMYVEAYQESLRVYVCMYVCRCIASMSNTQTSILAPHSLYKDIGLPPSDCCAHARMYACMHVYVHVHVYAYAWVCICMYVL